jgi:MtN3 and saliva related transmembrane protein
MVSTILGITAATWGLIMGLAPALQIRQMLRTRSSKDVSVGYFGILLPGFVLWVAYGAARHDYVVMIPNVVALVVGVITFSVAMYLRSPTRADRARGRAAD